MKVLIQGDIFHSIGPDAPCICGVTVEGDSAAARGPIRGELSDRSGSLTFSAVSPTGEIEVSGAPVSAPATPKYTARGFSVRISRDASGVISVEKLR